MHSSGITTSRHFLWNSFRGVPLPSGSPSRSGNWRPRAPPWLVAAPMALTLICAVPSIHVDVMKHFLKFLFPQLLVAAALSAGEIPAGVELRSDVVYKSVGDTELQLDLYRPVKNPGNLPVLVWYHGGGYRKGGREDFQQIDFFRDFFLNLVAEGRVAVAVPGFRNASPDTDMAAIAGDARDAVRWLIRNHRELGIDPTRIGLTGHSSGGHLAMLAGLAGPGAFPGDSALASTPVTARLVIAMSPPVDFERHASALGAEGERVPRAMEKVLEYLFGASIEANPEPYRAASPVTYLNAGSPPVLAMFGQRDDDLYPHAGWLEESAKSAGAPVEVIRVSGARHQIYRGYRGMEPGLESLAESMRSLIARGFGWESE